ncbi:MAG: hypothetical protein OWQ54_10210 [Sulfolobaceae archaeon]|nr:hypothetical protein [Sulfolobaceae archaeon]
MSSICCFLQYKGKAVNTAIDLAKEAAKMFENLPKIVQGKTQISNMPEYIPPTNGFDICSKEAALYYTFSIAIDYQAKADILWDRLRKAYVDTMREVSNKPYNGLFYPEVILSYKDRPEELANIIKKLIGPRSHNYAAKIWLDVASKLKERYGSDPREITHAKRRVSEVFNQIKDFKGLRGIKIRSLYIRVMWSLGLFKISDPENIPVAVDRHVCRFTYLNVCGHQPPENACDKIDVKEEIADFWTEVSREAEKVIGNKQWLKFPYYDCEERKWKYINRIIPGYIDEVMWGSKENF